MWQTFLPVGPLFWLYTCLDDENERYLTTFTGFQELKKEHLLPVNQDPQDVY